MELNSLFAVGDLPNARVYILLSGTYFVLTPGRVCVISSTMIEEMYLATGVIISDICTKMMTIVPK